MRCVVRVLIAQGGEVFGGGAHFWIAENLEKPSTRSDVWPGLSLSWILVLAYALLAAMIVALFASKKRGLYRVKRAEFEGRTDHGDGEWERSRLISLVFERLSCAVGSIPWRVFGCPTTGWFGSLMISRTIWD